MNFFEYFIAIHWTQQIASCHWPCYGGLTAKIIGPANMVYMVSHAMENLQQSTDYPNMVSHATENLQHRKLDSSSIA